MYIKSTQRNARYLNQSLFNSSAHYWALPQRTAILRVEMSSILCVVPANQLNIQRLYFCGRYNDAISKKFPMEIKESPVVAVACQRNCSAHTQTIFYSDVFSLVMVKFGLLRESLFRFELLHPRWTFFPFAHHFLFFFRWFFV